MKNTLRNLSAVFIILLSACSSSSQQEITPTFHTIPTLVTTKTPTKIVSGATPTASKIVQTLTKDNTAVLSKLLPNCGDTELSPSQNWATGFCNNDETWIVEVNQTAKWAISYGEYYGRKADSGNGIIAPFYWSLDNKYLYLTIQRGVSGPIYFVDGWGLIRLDLANGSITETLSPIQHQYYSFSLSLDGKYLAYVLQPAESLTVNVINLETDKAENHNLTPEYNQAGRILWSPNMSKIVLGQAIIDDTEIKPNSFSVVVINLADDSRQILVSDNSVQITPKTWVDENMIELSDTDGKVWVYNFRDKTMIEKTE